MSGKLDIIIEQGADFQRTVQIKDKDGVVVDITGDTFEGDIRKTYSSTDETATFNITISDAANGKVSLALDYTTTTAINPGKYVYDIIWTPAANQSVRLLEGIAEVTPGVTR